VQVANTRQPGKRVTEAELLTFEIGRAARDGAPVHLVVALLGRRHGRARTRRRVDAAQQRCAQKPRTLDLGRAALESLPRNHPFGFVLTV
jgi:hypothetical protein